MKFLSLEKFLDNMVETRKVAGCCVAIWREGECVFRAFRGEAQPGRAVGARSAFRLASMTKPLTAAAVLLAAADGRLDLSDPVSDYLPFFAEMYLADKGKDGFLRGEQTGPITIRNLLTHTSGLGCGESGEAQYDAVKPREGDTLATAVERYSTTFLEFRPGTAQLYSPVLAMDVAARVVEVVTGKPYGQFLRERVLLPLGMRETSYSLADYRAEDLVYTSGEDGRMEPPLSAFDTFPLGYTGGGAGLISTLGDYCRFAEALRRAQAGEEGIFPPASVREMARPQLSEELDGILPIFNWGYGVRTMRAQTEDQPLTPGSFGWSGAYGTHFWIDPSHALTAVYLHNSSVYGGSGAPFTRELERAVMESL